MYEKMKLRFTPTPLQKAIRLRWIKVCGFIEKNEKFILLGIILILFLHGAIILNYPPMKDNGMFLYIGRGILNGEVPYRDNFDMKPPGIYFIYAFIAMLFGGGIKEVYLFDLFYTLITSLALWKLGKYLFGSRVGLLSSFMYGFLYFTYGNVWYYGQAEGFSNLPIILGIYFFFLAQDKRKKLFSFFSGLFLGVAFLIKFPMVIGIIFLLLLGFLGNKGGLKVKEKRGAFLIFLLGLFVVHIPILLYFIFHNALKEMLYILLVYTPQYAQSVNISYTTFFERIIFSLAKVFEFFAVYTGPLAIFSLFGLVMIFRNSFSTAGDRNIYPSRWVVLPVWCALSLINVAIQGKFFEYHWIPVYVPVSIISALGMVYFFKNFSKYRTLFSIILFCGFIFSSVLFIRLAYFYKDNVNYLLGKLSYKAYLTRFSRFPLIYDFSPSTNETLADYIKQNTKASDFIYIWGTHPEIYILSNRKSSSRFLMAHQLYCSWAPSEWKETFLEELYKKPPQLIIVTKGDFFPEVSGIVKDSWQQLKEFKEFYPFLMDNYLLVKRIDMFSIYKKR